MPIGDSLHTSPWDRVLIAITIRGAGWAYLGMIPLITGTIGFCSLYALLGMRTYEVIPDFSIS
jgi:hypothetical protein